MLYVKRYNYKCGVTYNYSFLLALVPGNTSAAWTRNAQENFHITRQRLPTYTENTSNSNWSFKASVVAFKSSLSEKTIEAAG